MATLVFEDNFTDSDGTLLTAHTPDTDTHGNGWANIKGSASVESNKASETGAVDDAMSTVDITSANHAVYATLTVPTTTSAEIVSLLLRATDDDNHFEMRVRADTQMDLEIVERTTGSTVVRKEIDVAYSPGDVVVVCAVCYGDDLLVLDETNGVLLHLEDSSFNTITKAGFRLRPAGTITNHGNVDSLKIYTADANESGAWQFMANVLEGNPSGGGDIIDRPFQRAF